MIRRLFVLSVALGWLLLLCVGSVRAQSCTPSNQPTFNVPKPQALSPSDYANQTGRAAVTVTMSAPGATGVFHKGTFGVGTQVNVNLTAYNFANSLQVYYQWDASGWVLWYTFPSGGNFQFTTTSAMIGHTIYIKLVGTEKQGSGSFTTTTQDVDNFTVINQASGTYYYDGNDSNVYWLMSHTYSGTPQIDYSNGNCSNVAEKPGIPTATMQIYNASSGESRNGVTIQGATGVMDNQSLLSASAWDYVSALPGDTIKVNYGGQMFCSAIGDFWKVDQVFRIEGAVVVVKDLGHPPQMGPGGVSIYDIAPICQNNCDPPDWEPKVVYSWVGRQPYWVGECQLLRAPDVAGFPWIPLCDVMNDASKAFGSGLIPTTIQLATGGLSLPYPGPAPDLPIPGKCTKYPVNVLFSVGPKDLLNFFKNLLN